MTEYHIDVVASKGKSVTRQSTGLPDEFVPLVNKYWWIKKNRLIAAVLLPNRSSEAWRVLGQNLISLLVEAGTSYGACMLAEGKAQTPLAWTAGIIESQIEGAVSFLWQSAANTRLAWNDQYVQWFAVQRDRASSWAQNLWTTTASDFYHVDAHLMFVAYDVDALEQLSSDQPLTLDSFSRGLRHVAGWLVPLDGNLGFLLGCSEESAIWGRLLQREL